MLKANFDEFSNVLNQFGTNRWLLQVPENLDDEGAAAQDQKSAARKTHGRQVRWLCLVRMVVPNLRQQERIEDQTHHVKAKPSGGRFGAAGQSLGGHVYRSCRSVDINDCS
jgi:hypothetical protein